MTHYATTYLKSCSCSLPNEPVEFTVEDHKQFKKMMDSGHTAVQAYTKILNRFYRIERVQDIRICCANSLFAGHGIMSGFPQDVVPEELQRSTNYDHIPEVTTLDSTDYVGENDPFIDIFAAPEVEAEFPQTNEPGIIIKGFRTNANGEEIKIDVGLGLKVRILDTNTDIFRGRR